MRTTANVITINGNSLFIMELQEMKGSRGRFEDLGSSKPTAKSLVHGF
jgi:hypothetical protein